MDTDRLLLLVSLTEIIPFEHPRDIVMGTQMNQILRCHPTHPATVELHQGLCRIENFKDLPLIGLGIFQYLLFRQGNTRLRLTSRIADHTGKIADQENDFMPELLKMLELVNQDRMAQMKVRRGRIEAGFHAQWPVFFQRTRQLRFKLSLLNNLHDSAKD